MRTILSNTFPIKLKRYITTNVKSSTSSRSEIYNAIVIGLGGVGSFALRSLSKKSEDIRVLGIEQFDLGHTLGSSHGDSRLFRHAYFEHPNYVPLCLRSTTIFQELCDWKRMKSTTHSNIRGGERVTTTYEQHVPLLERCGVLILSDAADGDKPYEIIRRCQESAQLHNIPVMLLDSDELRQRYGKLFHMNSYPNGKLKGLLEPGAGFVRPELALRYAIEDAIDNGAEVIENSPVISMHPSNSDDKVMNVKVSTGKVYQTRSILVSAGAWASKIIPQWASYLTVTRQVQAWFQPKDVEKFRPSPSSPGWYLDTSMMMRHNDMSHNLPLYGFPADTFSRHHSNHVKIALHGRNVPFDPDELFRPDVTNEEMDELRDAVQHWIPEASDRMVASKACLYTMSPDGHFIFDRAPGFDTGQCIVWCIAGLSGHGFKMTPALGEAAADLLIEGETELPISFLSTNRLNPLSDS